MYKLLAKFRLLSNILYYFFSSATYHSAKLYLPVAEDTSAPEGIEDYVVPSNQPIQTSNRQGLKRKTFEIQSDTEEEVETGSLPSAPKIQPLTVFSVADSPGRVPCPFIFRDSRN